jgi:putative Mn2+ efflux pump MntP
MRKLFDVGLPLIGMFLVFLAALWVQDLQIRVILILMGLLLIWVGVWKLANPLYPNERRFDGLRVEVDRFIVLVRQLNQAAIQLQVTDDPEAERRFDGLVAAMGRSVERMAALAGRDKSQIRIEEEEIQPFRSTTRF